jgi:DnaJ-class molecular chaperone
MPRRLIDLKHTLKKSIIKAREIFAPEEPQKQKPQSQGPRITSLSLLEVSISIFEAITGHKKTVEIAEHEGVSRKVSVVIPPGARQGSVIRMRSNEDESEEIIMIIRIAPHPWLSVSHRGLTMEIPITVEEAIAGAKIQVPSLADPLLVTVEPGMQSGSEVRLKGQGITSPDGSRGDLYIRFMIKVPAASTSDDVAEKAQELTPFYTEEVRKHIPRSILEPKVEEPA